MMVHPRVFISSYKADPSHLDMQFASRLIADLSAAGAIVATSGGANDTMQRLDQILKHCQWLVLVQTPASLVSPQVRAEVDTALNLAAQGKLRGVLSIIAAPCDARALPANWAALRSFDAVQNYQQALLALQTALELSRPEFITVMAGNNFISPTPTAAPQAFMSPVPNAAPSPAAAPQPFMSPTVAAAPQQFSASSPVVAPLSPAASIPSDVPTMFSQPAKARRPAVLYPLRTLLITLLVIVLIVAGVGGFFLAKNAIITFNAGALQNAVHATITAQAQNAANAAIHSPHNLYPPGSGRLVLNNALIASSSAGNWQMNGNCTIKNNSYDVAESAGTGFASCYDQNTNFSNFVYQAQVRIINGYAAGLIFRAGAAAGHVKFYYFQISENGSYSLSLVTGQLNASGQQLQGGANAAIIRTGPGQLNALAVVARDHYLDFYVNLRYLFSVTNGSLASGQIGVFVYDHANAAEAAFTYVKVWQI